MSDNDLLVHAIKALAYRFTKAIQNSADTYGAYKITPHTRSPAEILNHMYDLVNKTQTMVCEGHFTCLPPAVLDFDGERDRLLDGLQTLQKTVVNTSVQPDICKRLLQGPILDIATHIGQLAMLNGLNGNKIPKESYYNADLT